MKIEEISKVGGLGILMYEYYVCVYACCVSLVAQSGEEYVTGRHMDHPSYATSCRRPLLSVHLKCTPNAQRIGLGNTLILFPAHRLIQMTDQNGEIVIFHNIVLTTATNRTNFWDFKDYYLMRKKKKIGPKNVGTKGSKVNIQNVISAKPQNNPQTSSENLETKQQMIKKFSIQIIKGGLFMAHHSNSIKKKDIQIPILFLSFKIEEGVKSKKISNMSAHLLFTSTKFHENI
ncbi:hypothetical protein NQ315_008868 [Exocentrus adspersus]|uniref:Uncharacterized protein n=1 Tax=Exocentrus adspersus TaxID=1586481 RepID=A0AAV8V8E6_9CUCU|nr:hypothetical protein NQ315_008868 [Exocentrus adspersus]